MEPRSYYKSVLPFLPLLFVYIIIVLVFSSDAVIGDEKRYLEYARNLAQGFYTDSANPELRNGPGYPFLIYFAVLWEVPHLVIKLMNAIFLTAGIIFFYRTLLFYIKPKRALILAYVLGLYPPFLKWTVFMYSESFSVFLICGFLYFFLRMHRESAGKYLNMGWAAFFLGILALTKVIFGYVIVGVLVLMLPYFIFKKSRKAKNSHLALAGSLLLCLPYLIYTYSITGKVFLWGTGGGEILYWRSTPFPDEYGDWVDKDLIMGLYDNPEYYETSGLIENHRPFIEGLEGYTNVEKDSIYKKKALAQMREHPLKYAKNTGASAFRLFFNYPYSYTPQKTSTYFYILPNMFLLVFLISSVYLAIRNPSFILFEVRYIGLIALIFVSGLILLDGHVRHLLPAIPLFLFIIVFVHKRLIRIETKVPSRA